MQAATLGFHRPMVKHRAFWIGFFAAALLIIPVAVGIWGSAGDFARNVAVFLFGAISVLIIVLVLPLFFRDRLLRRVLGTAETSLDDVLASLVKGVSAAAHGDRDTAEAEAHAFAKSATGWYVWSGFYRWVIASALGLLLAFGAFTGTVLLFEQNRKLSEQTVLMGQQGDLMQAQTDRLEEQSTQFQLQNEIMMISLVSELRAQLELTVERTTLGEVLEDEGTDPEEMYAPAFLVTGESCALGWNPDASLSYPPSQPIIEAVIDLGIERQISGRVIRALEYLLLDRDSAIAFGALQALDRLVDDVDVEDVYFENLIVTDTALNGRHDLHFDDSLVSGFTCFDCDLELANSFSFDTKVSETSAFYSVLFTQDAPRFGPNVAVLLGQSDIPDTAAEMTLGPAYASLEYDAVALFNIFDEDSCTLLQDIASQNDLVRFIDLNAN